LLFPGSMVDVMVSFKQADHGTGWREALTTTLLQGIQVLALDKQSVLSPGKMMDEVTSRQANSRRITLLVDTKQAKALELAMDQGTLSLALRNPLDNGDTDKELVSVHSIIGDVPPIALHENPSDGGLNLANSIQSMLAALALRDLGARDLRKDPSNPPGVQLSKPQQEAPSTPQWDVTVIHGFAAEKQSFPMPGTRIVMDTSGSK